LGTGHSKIDTSSIGQKTKTNRHGKLPKSIFMCLVSNITRVYLSVSCTQCYPCLSFCVLFPMFPVSIVMCLVPNVTHIYFSVSCAQCYSCLSFCVLYPMLPVSIFLCLVPNVTRVYLSVSCAKYRKIDTGNIGYKTQKDRHG
jgi:nitrogen fixation-related uncharacterized protein